MGHSKDSPRSSMASDERRTVASTRQKLQAVDVSVIVKALNEERNIGRCLDSVMRETRNMLAEIVLVDSLSTDQTVTIAQHYPITIARFLDPRERGPGAAVEVGFRLSRGRYIYVLDGDMEFEQGFLATAIEWLEKHPGYAGVAGVLRDKSLVNIEDRRREASRLAWRGGDVDHLGSGGLYRREVIERLGYFGHKALQAYEEAELGIRLSNAGWKLHRLNVPAVVHTGHHEGSIALIRRHWRTGRIFASGVFLRSALRHAYVGAVLRKFSHLIGITGWWLGAGCLALFGRGTEASAMIAAVVVAGLGIGLKKGCITDGYLSLIAWHVGALGLFRGLTRRVRDPRSAIRYEILQSMVVTFIPESASKVASIYVLRDS